MITNYHIRDFSSNNPSTIVFILHGYGADGANLVDLADVFSHTISNAIFIIPDAPFPHEYMPDMGRQWFSLADRNETLLLQGAEIARLILLKLIDEKLTQYNLSYKNLVLMGFSQGAMMSLYTALKLPEVCKAVIGFSGAMVSAEETIASCVSKPSVCMVHGMDDDVIPCSLGKFTVKTLNQHNIPAVFYEIPHLGHSIDGHGIRFVQEFLSRV